jgi:hypothetical protein
MTVTKIMFLQDMEFYGIVPEVGTIQLDSDDLLAKLQISSEKDLESAITRKDLEKNLKDNLLENQLGEIIGIGLRPGRYNLKALKTKLDILCKK